MASNGSISVSIPKIWPNNIRCWFAVLECNFEVAEIKCQKVKFCHLCGLLTEDIVSQVSDIIPNAYESETPYDDLKKAIIERTEMSVTRAMKILSKEYMGDEMPTEFLRRIRQLTSNAVMDDFYMKHFFFSRLPESVQSILKIVLDKNEIFELARTADLIMETLPVKKHANYPEKTDSFDTASRTESDSTDHSRQKICWYHRKYGNLAYYCKSPCDFDN